MTAAAIAFEPGPQTRLERLILSPQWPRIQGRIQLSPAGCWLWQGALNSAGYPVMKLSGRTVLVTRWILATGVRRFRPRELACHSCDIKPCIHPDHLDHGSYSRNLRDAWARRRRSRPSTFIEVRP